MNKKALLALAIFTIVVVSVFVYGNIILKQVPQYPFSQSQSSPNPTSSPTPTSSPPPATVTANLQTANIRPPIGYYLSINGTVTNNSPNTAYGVGLKVTAKTEVFRQEVTMVNNTYPIASGTYYSSDNSSGYYSLSQLAPYQSVPVVIRIELNYQSETPILQDVNVTVVWSNAP